MSTSPASLKQRNWMLFFLTIFSLYQIGILVYVLENSAIYGEAIPSPLIQFGFGLIWLGIFAWGGWGVVRKKVAALGYISWIFLGFILFRLWQGWFFAQADYERNRLPFLIVLSGLILVIPLLRLWLGRGGKAN